MKIITLEEHYADPAIGAAGAAGMHELSPDFGKAYDPSLGVSYTPTRDVLVDVGERRIADMDTHGITMQVLSCLSTQQVPADVAPDLVRGTNDKAAQAVSTHPDRFAAFASLPTTAPEAAARELARCIDELGFVGTMIHGRTDGDFLDDERFDPILSAVARRNVPLYLHPSPPPRSITDASYAGLDPIVGARFQTSAWGWHQETAIHFLHLLLAGVFDRYPDLQVILGHWGEMIPFYLDRLDEALPQKITRLERSVADYVHNNVYITPSGMFSQAQLRYCLDVIGIDRMLYSVDYPFVENDGAVDFLDESDLDDEAKNKFAHGNTEALLGI